MLKPQSFQILLSLAGGPLHGLAVRDEVLERTDGAMHLWPATLYRSLQRLEKEGLIRETSAPDDADVTAGSPRFYELSPAGRTELERELGRLEQYLSAARAKNLEPS